LEEVHERIQTSFLSLNLCRYVLPETLIIEGLEGGVMVVVVVVVVV
jgi:hypothetical protein